MVAAAVIGATVVTAGVSMSAANKQAKAAKQAAQTSSDTQERIYNQQRADQEPWRIAGVQALDKMSKLYGISTKDINGTSASSDYSEFTKSPDYQFRLDQGNKSILANAAATGSRNSGATQKALLKYGQDYAGQAYDSYFSKLATLAGYGTQANAQNAQSGQNYAHAITGIQQNKASALSSSYANQANAINGGIANGLGAYMQMQGGKAVGAGSPTTYSGGNGILNRYTPSMLPVM